MQDDTNIVNSANSTQRAFGFWVPLDTSVSQNDKALLACTYPLNTPITHRQLAACIHEKIMTEIMSSKVTQEVPSFSDLIKQLGVGQFAHTLTTSVMQIALKLDIAHENNCWLAGITPVSKSQVKKSLETFTTIARLHDRAGS